jgi:hypothetical protein
MNAHRIPTRIARGLSLIRQEATRLESARFDGNSFEAKMAVKTIKEECEHLRQFVGLLVEKSDVTVE